VRCSKQHRLLDVKSKANVASEKQHIIKTDNPATAQSQCAPKKNKAGVHRSWADVAKSKQHTSTLAHEMTGSYTLFNLVKDFISNYTKAIDLSDTTADL
jgi:hypothetical protein